MKLLNTQELAVIRVQERNRLVDTYERLLGEYKALHKQMLQVQGQLEVLNSEVLKNLNSL